MRRNDDDSNIAAVLPISAPAGDRNYTQSEDRSGRARAKVEWETPLRLNIQLSS